MNVNVSVHNTTQVPQGGVPLTTTEPSVVFKTINSARAGQAEIAKGVKGLGDVDLLSSQGLKIALGKPSIKANLKDGVVHLMQKMPGHLFQNSVGSHFKEALRLSDQYQQMKLDGASPQEKIDVLRNLQAELSRHDQGHSVKPLLKFVDHEITVLENESHATAIDKEARAKMEGHQVDVLLDEVFSNSTQTRSKLFDEINRFDQSQLSHVDAPKTDGVPDWAQMEFLSNRLDNDVVDQTPSGTIQQHAPMLDHPGLDSLSDGFRNGPEITSFAGRLDTELTNGNTQEVDKLVKDLGGKIGKDVSSQGSLSETAFVISKGDKFKEELFEALKTAAPNSPHFKGKLEDAPEQVKTLLDGLYKSVLEEFPNRQTAPDKIMLNGKEYTKGAQIGAGAFGSVNIYEHQSEVTDPQTGIKSTVTERIAVKSCYTDNLEEVAAEVRAHQSAMGSQGHDNIVDMKGVIQGTDGSILIAMELAKDSLYNTLDRLDQAVKDGTLSPVAANAVRITLLKDMMQGLQHFQETRGMTHVDVKDPNFLIGLDGRAKLGDFGTAVTGTTRQFGKSLVDNPRWKAPEMVVESNLRDAEISRLKEAYNKMIASAKLALDGMNLSPEERQVKGKEMLEEINKAQQVRKNAVPLSEVTNKVDTWSLGVVAYRLFNGVYPFDDPQFMSKAEKDLVDFGGDVSNRIRETGKDDSGNDTGLGVTTLDRMLNGMLHPDPEERPSITDLLRNPIFNEPSVGSDEAYAIIKELTEKTPDMGKVKALSQQIGD